tara:strand:+ start:5780 stop:6529 length:750 start_codon:yes stop_codon:yes gene_type:complete
MQNNFNSLFKKIFKRSYKLYHFKQEAITIYFMALVSFLVTPFFILLKFSANFITIINFFVATLSLFLIFSLNSNLYIFGIVLYYVNRILDFCDGNVARFNNESTFYGRFLDAIVDIFFESLLLFAIHYYCYKIYSNELLFIFGAISSFFCVYGSCVADKYSSLARWSNDINKKKIKPYLRKSIKPRINFILYDIYYLCLMSTPFFVQDKSKFMLAVLLLTVSTFIFNILNITIHIIYAKKNLNKFAGDK